LRDRLAMRVEGRVDEGLTVALLEHFPGQLALGLALARRGHRGGIGHGAACVETGHDHARRAVNLPCAEVSDGPGLHGSLTLVARYSVWPPMLPSFRTLSALGATLLLAVLAGAGAARGAQGATVLPTGTGPAFEYAYAPPTAPGLQAIHQRVRDADLWRRLPEMQAIDGMFALPRPLRYVAAECGEFGAFYRPADAEVDRKSTRLNSSHVKISYAVFCLKKKKTIDKARTRTPPTKPSQGGPANAPRARAPLDRTQPQRQHAAHQASPHRPPSVPCRVTRG